MKVQTKFIFADTIAALERKVNECLNKIQVNNGDIIDIKYQDGSTDEIAYYTSLIIYRS